MAAERSFDLNSDCESDFGDDDDLPAALPAPAPLALLPLPAPPPPLPLPACGESSGGSSDAQPELFAVPECPAPPQPNADFIIAVAPPPVTVVVAKVPGAAAAAAPPMTAAEASWAAAAEGLRLVKSKSASGYKWVQHVGSVTARPYQLKVGSKSGFKHLGFFATAEEAALTYARSLRLEESTREALGLKSQAAAPREMSAGEAKAAAAAEGRPFELQIWQDGQITALGFFATAEEAKLAYARSLAVESRKRKHESAPAPAPASTAMGGGTRRDDDGDKLLQDDVEDEE